MTLPPPDKISAEKSGPAVALRAQAAALAAQADALTALADALERAPSSNDVWLGSRELRERYHFTPKSLAAAATSGLAVRKGARGRVVVRQADVEAWIAAREWKPKPRKASPPAADLEGWEKQAARAVGGGR